MAATDACFHCALPIPAGSNFNVEIDGELRTVCCLGCKAVAELIRESGMSSYYRLRDFPVPGAGKPLASANDWSQYNTADMLQAFAEVSASTAECTVFAGGIYCAACSWLIESSLEAIDGVDSVSVDPMTHRVRICFQPRAVGIGDLLAALAALGYDPQVLAPGDTARPEVAEQRTALKRLLVASLGMMQVMMFAVGLYSGAYYGIDSDMRQFLRLVSFFVTTPVVFYAAKPFFAGAWRGLLARSPGMDLPVSIAIGSAYAASVYATFSNGPAVWFDSVSMFVFFLSLGRYLEMRARHRSVDRSAALSTALPNTAIRLDGDAQTVVPVSELRQGNVIRIRGGDAIPADGTIVSGSTSVDEALLTGESRPLIRRVGDEVAAGSINLDHRIDVRVLSTGSDTTIGAIARLSERARRIRPTIVHLADRIASIVVVALLFVAALVAAYWAVVDPEKAFVTTLSVLVVTCPCALALATPAAYASAASRFSQLQLLVTNGDAIEALSKATHIVFDKTGTLTSGRPGIESCRILDPARSADECFRYAAALEQASSHPLAHAFRTDAGLPQLEDPRIHLGKGVSAGIGGHEWRIGTASFATEGVDGDAPHAVYLGVDGQAVAEFIIRDPLRHDADAVLRDLRDMGLTLSLASGDRNEAVSEVAGTLRFDTSAAGCSPADKLALIHALQARGECVVMVGDGINDAPVLAAANASIAPGHGALLAQTNADVIMLGDSLRPVATAVRLSRATLRIVRQNLAWAIVYNATALPLAATGFVPPWLAAAGMSFSSLVVVLNALRLNRFG